MLGTNDFARSYPVAYYRIYMSDINHSVPEKPIDQGSSKRAAKAQSSETGHYRGESIPIYDTPTSAYQNGRSRNGGTGNYSGEDTVATSDDDATEVLDLKQIFGLLIHHKWIIALVTFVCTLAAVVYSLSITPIYESQATIIIQQAPNRYSMAGNDLSSLLMSSYGIGVGSTVDQELEVLKSRTLAKDLAERVLANPYMPDGRSFPILRRSKKDSSLASVDTVASRIIAFKRISQVSKMSNVVKIGFESPSSYEAAYMANLMVDVYSQVSTNQNRVQAKAALEFLKNERNNVERQVNAREETLREFMNQSQIVALDSQTEELVKLISTLEASKRSVDVQLVATAQAIEQYTKELDGLKPGLAQQFSSAIAPQLQRYQFQLSELETERTLMLSKNPQLRDNPEAAPRFKQLVNQINVIKQEMSALTKDILGGSDQSMIGFLGSAEGGMGAKIQSYRDALLKLQIEKVQQQAQSEVMGKQLTQYNKVFENLPDNMMELARMKRELLVNEQLYLTISRQAAEMALWEQTQSGLARVVDYGEIASMPAKPKKRVIVIFGFIIGLGLSLAFVVVGDWTKKEIDSIEKLRRKGYPVMAVIPDIDDFISKNFDGAETVDVDGRLISTALVTFLDSISPLAESYRRLQSNVTYSKPDEPYRCLLVSSSNKSEGKSTLTANLAITLAESGNRVVIVDCDFRRPRVHKIFGVPKLPGVVEQLFSNKPVQDFVQETIVPNLFVLTAGNKPPNPAEINRSKKLKAAIEELKNTFDYVLLDTPPYGIITDAAPLIKLVDGVILVAKLNQTISAEFDHTIDNLKRINANVIGTVMNAYDKRKTSGYYYSDYYYQYSYDSYNAYEKQDA